jgi:hypothetical protein
MGVKQNPSDQPDAKAWELTNDVGEEAAPFRANKAGGRCRVGSLTVTVRSDAYRKRRGYRLRLRQIENLRYFTVPVNTVRYDKIQIRSDGTVKLRPGNGVTVPLLERPCE